MKYYSYYPGCSSEATAKGLGVSVEAISKPLDIELIELEGWTCCGSTPYGSLDELEALIVGARELALAEKRGFDLVTPCSSCYVTLNKARTHLNENPKLAAQANEALAEADLSYHGNIKVRHFSDVLVEDVTPEAIAARVTRKLTGLKVAPYAGCQLVRPKFGNEDTELPRSIDRLVECTGAEAVPFPLKARCCGGSLVISEEPLALSLMYKLFKNAADNGAECIATPCPLCQMNLDAYQAKVNSKYKTSFNLPVFFISQLIGVALGLDNAALGLGTNIISPYKLLGNIKSESGVESGT